MSVCGVDEAGRGSVIGPLVVAGVSVEPRRLRRLARLGVRDSKELSAGSRESLYAEIVEASDACAIIRVAPRVIDRYVARRALNELEAERMAEAISRLGAPRAYVDACDPDARRFGRTISGMLGERAARVHSYHRADSRFTVVSAASIIAKVSRDRSVARIRRRHGVGSGYPSDPECVRFLTEHASSGEPPPRFARRTWGTIRRIYG